MKRKFSSRSVQLLPPEIWDLCRKRLHQFLGFNLICLGLLILVSVLSYHPMDASLNTASAGQLTNWAGGPGALLADVFLQLFGIASFMILFALGVWGSFLMIEAHLRRPFLKMGLLLLSVILASTALTAAPRCSWFFDLPHVGGVVGISFLKLLTKLVPATVTGMIQMANAAFCGIIYAIALGLNLTQWATVFKRLRTLSTKGYEKGWGVVSKGVALLSSLLYRRSLPEDLSEEILEEIEDTNEKPVLRADISDKIRGSSSASLFSGFSREKESDLSSLCDPLDTPVEEEDKSYETSSFKGISPPPRFPSDTSFVPEDYQFPSIDLLDSSIRKSGKSLSDDQLQGYAKQLEQVLSEFGVKGEIVGICPGPVVTLYELKPAPGIKSSRVISLADDIARSMSAHAARIAVIPGRNVIGIELPNPTRETVYLRELLLSEDYRQHSASLAMILGKDIGGNPVVADLARMPHLLVAGTTGSGKSVSVNTMILSLLYRMSPDQCKFIMIDPKMLELSVYDGIPHLLTSVVTDPKKAVVALKWAVREMESRYRAMSKLGVRNIDGYNARVNEAQENGEILMRRVQTGFDPDTGKPIFENQPLDVTPLPYIVVVVDEMADLMLVAGKEIEAAVQRLAQMARAAGIHLIMATQRPSVDVITGTIKANFPTRISFMVTSKIDSRTILGEQGAEQLLGQGDMLYMAGAGRLLRVHGPFVKDTEVERIVQFLKTQGEPTYIDSVTEDTEEFGGLAGSDEEGGNALYQQAVELVHREGKASTSFIQRHLQIGYNRAARLIDQMEKEGLISAPNHVGKREIL
jgi:DNA segregation ATPase FtsK/SpoIIIE, S-DNA-T family